MNDAPFPFTLRQLQYVVAVAEDLSFRRAAERCRVSQPALSAQIAQMEALLGVKVFERNRRRVMVTPVGQAFVEQARRVLLAARDLAAFARESADPHAGVFRIGVIPTVARYLLPAVTPALRRTFPKLRLQWVEEKTGELLARMQAGELDGALVALEAGLGEVERFLIARDPFVLVVPAGHELADPSVRVTPQDLDGRDVLILQDEHCLARQTATLCAGSGAQVDAFRATSLTTIVQMVASGAGVTLLPALAVPAEVTDAALTVRRFAGAAPGRDLGLVWRKTHPLGETLRSIGMVLREAYPSEGDASPRHGS
ncbi:MAG: LysR family transcriptional regulator [Verrucomicrobia bacterium]|nr:MAG: LysR family transcriptional regulator [Verrucomicrobiota bacterium]